MVENAIRKGGHHSKGEKTVKNAFNAALSAGELIISLLHGEANGLNPGGFPRAGLIKPGGRDEALITILNWAAKVDGQSSFITDPYFGPDDLELLFEIAKAAPKSPLRVLTGRRTLHSAIPDGNFESAFADAWRSVCDAGAAEIEICIIGVNSDGDHPIHERWMLASDNWLRLGTSAKSLGNFRVSELTRIESDELKERRALVGDFLDRKTRTWQGNRVTLSSFDLL